jgi:GNAT superfamily N-acetyltransferase
MICTYRLLKPGEASSYEKLAIASYRGKLAQLSENEPIIALAATFLGRKVGLAVLEIINQHGQDMAILASIYIVPEFRGRGFGKELLQQVEKVLKDRNINKIKVYFIKERNNSVVLEGLLAGANWSIPRNCMIQVTSSIEKIQQAPWFKNAAIPEGWEIFSWKDLPGEERLRLEQENRQEWWIPSALLPAGGSGQFIEREFEPHTSVGLYANGHVEGWMINYKLNDTTLLFSKGWVKKRLQRSGRSLPFISLLAESIQRFSRTNYQFGIWQVANNQPAMQAFTLKRLVPYSLDCKNIVSTEKSLT